MTRVSIPGWDSVFEAAGFKTFAWGGAFPGFTFKEALRISHATFDNSNNANFWLAWDQYNQQFVEIDVSSHEVVSYVMAEDDGLFPIGPAWGWVIVEHPLPSIEDGWIGMYS